MSTVNTTYLPTGLTTNTLAAQGTNSSSSTNTSSGGLQALTPTDFIQMMITQLQNQDPLDPTNSQDILSQMSEIGQLQSSDQLQTSLTGLVLQNQIGSSSSLIGKSVTGIDASNNQIQGTVTGVQVDQSSNTVSLTLDNGDTLPLTGVASIAQASSSTPTAGTSGSSPTNTSDSDGTDGTGAAAAAIQNAIQYPSASTVEDALQSVGSALP